VDTLLFRYHALPRVGCAGGHKIHQAAHASRTTPRVSPPPRRQGHPPEPKKRSRRGLTPRSTDTGALTACCARNRRTP
jgi:hypothetical protein